MFSVEEIREIAAPIAKDYGIAGLYLFGSYARGDAHDQSDLDFRFDKPKGMSLFKIGGLQYQLSKAFGLPVDVVTTGQLSAEFKKEIGQYEVMIYGE
ncbi:nucleotidyltransferase domain-containing protein [Anaerovoracaceae bacterium 42-11]